MTEDKDSKPTKSRRLTYALLGALAISVTITFIYKAVRKGGNAAEIHWQCVPNENRSVTCVFDVSSGSGSMCFDLVLNCSDGRHLRNVCSGPVTAGSNVSVDLVDFEPPLAPDVVCKPPVYLNQKTTVE